MVGVADDYQLNVSNNILSSLISVSLRQPISCRVSEPTGHSRLPHPDRRGKRFLVAQLTIGVFPPP